MSKRVQDWRGIITIFIITGCFGLAFFQLSIQSEDGAHIPPWASGALGTAMAFYFMDKFKNSKK